MYQIIELRSSKKPCKSLMNVKYKHETFRQNIMNNSSIENGETIVQNKADNALFFRQKITGGIGLYSSKLHYQ